VNRKYTPLSVRTSARLRLKQGFPAFRAEPPPKPTG